MKIKLLVGRAGPGCVNVPGDVIEVSEQEGKARIERGEAEPVKNVKIEKAVINESPTNNSSRKRTRKR